MKVNLDALIQREDFEVIKDSQISAPTLNTIAISELEQGKFFLTLLRKPDFQRETNEWTPDKICDFILSFLDDNLIPSIILWNSGSKNFVIDGAHRLSALISWVLDDYGDGIISRAFFGHNVSLGQNIIADKTRKLVKKKVGSYKDYQYAVTHPDSSDSIMLARAQRLAFLSLQLQWVRGNALQAESSFFKINEAAAPINDTERTLLKSRNKPNAIAARAIVRSGTGHKYWSKFEETQKNSIEELSKELNILLFTPNLETPIKTLDIPLAGKGYSAETLSLIFDVVNLANYIENKNRTKAQDPIFVKKENGAETEIIDDIDGEKTIELLKRTRKMMFRISSSHASSLGLHPAVYFYSNTGRYQITSFLAIIEMMKDFDKENFFNNFIKIRASFEAFLIKYKIFINQTTIKYGSALKGYRQLKQLFRLIIDLLIGGFDPEQIIEKLNESKEYAYLNAKEIELEYENRKEFSTDSKSGVFLKEAFEHPIRCKICKGFIHQNSTSIDHIDRKQDGGKGTIDNGQLTHPYCNTTFKN